MRDCWSIYAKTGICGKVFEEILEILFRFLHQLSMADLIGDQQRY